jgi:hypothetical protein
VFFATPRAHARDLVDKLSVLGDECRPGGSAQALPALRRGRIGWIIGPRLTLVTEPEGVDETVRR